MEGRGQVHCTYRYGSGSKHMKGMQCCIPSIKQRSHATNGTM